MSPPSPPDLPHPPRKFMDFLSIVKIAVGLVCSSIALHASTTVTVTFDSVSPGMTISGSFTGAGGFANRSAGVINFDFGDAFCVEPMQPVSGTVVYDIQPTGSLTNLTSISKVIGAYLQSSQSNLEAAGAQWAIWEIARDGTSNPSFRGGNTQIFFRPRGTQPVNSEALEAKALQYLSASQLSSTPSASLLYVTNPTSQDMVFMVSEPSAVPEPSSALLGALGLTSLLIRRRSPALRRVS